MNVNNYVVRVRETIFCETYFDFSKLVLFCREISPIWSARTSGYWRDRERCLISACERGRCIRIERLRKDSPFFFSSFSFLSIRKASFSCSVYIMRRTLSTKENPSSPPSLAPSAIVAAGDRQQQTLLRTTNSPLLHCCAFTFPLGVRTETRREDAIRRRREPADGATYLANNEGKWKQWHFTRLSIYSILLCIRILLKSKLTNFWHNPKYMFFVKIADFFFLRLETMKSNIVFHFSIKTRGLSENVVQVRFFYREFPDTLVRKKGH